MECETSDSKKIFKVFEATKRKKGRKKREEVEETNSLGSTESKSLIHQANADCIKSAKASLQDVTKGDRLSPGGRTPKRESSNLSVTVSPGLHRSSRSPRRHRRIQREDLSLALNAGLISSPRSISPHQDGHGLTESITVDQDSFVYAFLEEAIKKEKKKHRRHRCDYHISTRDRHLQDRSCDREGDPEQTRDRDRDIPRHRDRDKDRERDRDRDRDRDPERYDASAVHEYHKRHYSRRHDEPSRDQNERPEKDKSQQPGIDQSVLFETFAKLCSTITEKNSTQARPVAIELMPNQSHKSLQCEVVSKNESCDVDQPPERLRSREPSHEVVHRSYTRVRSLEDVHGSRGRIRSPARPPPDDRREKYLYEKSAPKYSSKMDMVPSRTKPVDDERYRDYPLPARSCMDHAYRREPDRRDYREYDERRDILRERRTYEDDRKRFCEEERRRCCERTSRSFDPHREPFPEEDRLRRSTRSDSRKKRYEDARRYDDRDRRYDDRRDKYYEEREREYRDRHSSNLPSKDRRWRRNLERCERGSVASRDDDYGKERDGCSKERDGYSERERDSGLSVADEISTVSGKSNYMKVVKQGIAEQREAMEKMMKLWKELMRCFKSISQSPTQDKIAQDSAASMQESAAAQLRLWRECMRRYETVARDVGDTDARLMEEISKQRSEMAEMANMWQECLQRYRDMTNDFNSLKQQLATETPSRSQPSPRPPAPPRLADGGEGLLPAHYRLPPAYPPPPAMPPMGGYVGSPLRSRASAPPPWWWMNERAARRRSSPESRRSASRSRERKHRHKDRERDDARYKEKSSAKAAATRSENRHRKR